jgi:chromosome segregation ATPase
MLLDELLAERERPPVEPTPLPTLTVDPVSVPPTSDTGRRAVRQRLAELENAALRNFRSAEEARQALAEEHHRLQLEATARTEAQHEADALRRELDRLSEKEADRAEQEKARAQRAARSEIADELKRFEEERDRVLREMSDLRGSISEHNGLLDEYVTRLRDEQMARAELRAELERAQAAQSLAERNLERATESARHNAEDEMIRLATAEQQLADATSDRDRLAAQLAELTSGDGAIGRMSAQIEEKDAEIASLGVRLADLDARIAASEEAAQKALAERDDAWTARSAFEARLVEAEAARADAEHALEVAHARIEDLQAELTDRIETTDVRTRELDVNLGKLRREARDASNARRAAEETVATVTAERDALQARIDLLETDVARARADGDSLRAHASVLGDELAAARASEAELRAAAPAEPESAPEPQAVAIESADAADAAASDVGPDDKVCEEPSAETPPPLPLRVAGRHAPAPPARRRTRREPAVARAAAIEAAPEVAPEPVAAEAEAEAVETKAPGRPTEVFRRTALAEFSALATSKGDDFSYRHR